MSEIDWEIIRFLIKWPGGLFLLAIVLSTLQALIVG